MRKFTNYKLKLRIADAAGVTDEGCEGVSEEVDC